MKTFVVGLMFALVSAAIGYTFYTQRLIADQVSTQEDSLTHLENSVRLLSSEKPEINQELEGSVLAADVAQLKNDYAHFSHSVDELGTSAATFSKELGGYSERLQKLEVTLTEQKTTIREAVKSATTKALADLKATIAATPPVSLPTKKPAPTELPFEILTLETRGTEPFLVIARKGATSLSLARFYRAGDEIDGYWQLKVISPEQHLAIFVNRDNQTFTYRW